MLLLHCYIVRWHDITPDFLAEDQHFPKVGCIQAWIQRNCNLIQIF